MNTVSDSIANHATAQKFTTSDGSDETVRAATGNGTKGHMHEERRTALVPVPREWFHEVIFGVIGRAWTDPRDLGDNFGNYD